MNAPLTLVLGAAIADCRRSLRAMGAIAGSEVDELSLLLLSRLQLSPMGQNFKINSSNIWDWH